MTMKKIMILFAVIAGFTAFTAMRADTAPEFKFESETFEFGVIAQNKPVSHEFKFTNVGDEPLIISAVEPTCGCTIADYTKKPIKKGETGSVTLTYNAGVVGTFAKTATVKSNARTPVKVLYLKGEVKASEPVKTASN